MSDTAIPVGEFIANELEARGWTTTFAATLTYGDPRENKLWLDLLCCSPQWERHTIQFSDSEAMKLEQLFGISAETWMNLHSTLR